MQINSQAFRDSGNLKNVYFYGDVPGLYGYGHFSGCASSLVLYYLEEKEGWTSPTWNGYNTAAFIPEDDENLVRVEVPGGSLKVYLTTGMVVGYEGSPTEVEFPEEVQGTEIRGISTAVFYGCESLTSAVIPDNYTEIGINVFGKCPKLETVRIGSGIREIPKTAFAECASLGKVTLSEGLEKIEEGAFQYDGILEEAALPSTVQSIGKNAFCNCKKIKDVNLPEGLTEIGESAFYGCSALTEIVIPEGIEELPNSAFGQCETLQTAVLPEGIKKIGVSAFANCYNLETVNLPESVTELGNLVFSNCSSLTGIRIPSGVTRIPDQAFYQCRKLEKAELPEKLTAVGSYAFTYCSSLREVELPETVTELGVRTFENSGLERIRIPSGVTVIPESCFARSQLSEIRIPSGVTQINSQAFRYSRNLKNVYFYGRAPEIYGYGHFSDCSSDLILYYLKGKAGWTTPTWNGYKTELFEKENEDTPEVTETIGNATVVFDKQTGILKKVTGDISTFEIPVSIKDVAVTKIKTGCFEECSTLESITVAEGNENFQSEDGVLYNKDKTVLLVVPAAKSGTLQIAASTKEIQDRAAINCKQITELEIPLGLRKIGNRSFYRCSSLKEVILPDLLESLGAYAFADCTSLERFVLSEVLTELPAGILQNAAALKELTVPESIKVIRGAAMSYCSSLSRIYFEGDAPQIYGGAIPKSNGIIFYVVEGRCGWSVPLWNNWKTEYYSCNKYDGYGFFAADNGSVKYREEDGMIVGFTGEPENILIPSSVKNTTITGIAADAFMYCASLQNIYLPVTAKNIPENPFNPYEITENKLTVWGPEGEFWSNLAETYGWKYRSCGISSISPVAASAIGGKNYTISVRMLAGMELPVEFSWTDKETGQQIDIPYEKTVNIDSFTGITEYRLLLDLGNTDSGEYLFKIRSRDYGIQKEYLYQIDRTPPVALHNFRVQADNLVNVLSWNMALEGDLSRYEIYRKKAEEDSEYTRIAVIYDRMTTSFRDTNVEEDVEYFYKIAAVDRFDQASEPAGPIGSKPGQDREPPKILEVRPANHSVIHGKQIFHVKVTDNKGVSSAALEYSVDDGTNWTTADKVSTDGAAELTFDTAKVEEKAVKVRFLAEDIYQNTAYSEVIYQYTIDNQGPEKVQNLKYTATASVITLSWDDVADDDLSYFQVEQLQIDGSWKIVGTTSSVKGMYIKNMRPETKTVFRVAAYDIYGNRGTESDVLTAETEKDVTAPVVSGISPKPYRLQGMLKMQFTLSDDAGFESLLVQVSSDRKKWEDFRKISLDLQSTRTTVDCDIDTNLYEEGDLFVRGIVRDSSGNESISDETAPYVQYVIDRTAPPVPSNLGVQAKGKAARLTWRTGMETDLLGYYILRSEGENGAFSRIAVTGRTSSYTDNSVEFNKKYTYKIQAYDQAENISEASESVSVEIPVDTQKPVIYSMSPSEQYVLGGNTRIRVLAGDNDQVQTISSAYSLDGENWVKLEDILLEKQEDTVDLKLKPSDTGATDQLWIRISCEDRNKNVSEIFTRKYQVDLVPPAAPVLTAEETDGNTVLHWTSGREEDLAGFLIYRKAAADSAYSCIYQKVAENLAEYTWTDESTQEGVKYNYRVEAIDTRENASSSEAVTVFIPQGSKKDTIAPYAYISGDTVGEIGTELAFSAENSLDNVEIVSYNWDFGDGGSSELIKPVHAYAAAGTYTVKLTVRDQSGNEGTAELEVSVREKQVIGSVAVTVLDENGTPVEDAGVYADLGSEKMTVNNTDTAGKVTISCLSGSIPIGVYKSGYLPAKKEVQVNPNIVTEVVFTIEKKEIVAGELKSRRMSLEEILAAGIDVDDPANQQIYKFEIQLTYEEETITSEAIIDSEGKKLSDPEKFKIGDRVIVVDFVNCWGGNGIDTGGSSGTVHWPDGVTPDEPEPVVAVIDIPGTSSWLKDFFDVELYVMNQAGKEFSLDNCTATLNVPDGLTLMDTNRTKSDPVVNIGTLNGQQSATAEWILRGDTPGSYDLSADFQGTLRDFGVQVKANFATKDPVEVRGGEHLWLDVVTESEILEYTDGAIRVGFRNEDKDPVYYPKIKLENVQYVRSFKQKGSDSVDTSPDILEPGEEIWFDYIIRRQDWETLMKNPSSPLYLKEQILKKLSGVAMQTNFITMPPMTIAADKIKIFAYDSETGETGKELSILEIWKDTVASAKVPDLMIRTYKQDDNGQLQPASMTVNVVDAYKKKHTPDLETDYTDSFTTDENGEYVLKGYEIDDWKPKYDEDDNSDSNNRINYKAYDMTFWSSRALTRLSVVGRGSTTESGKLRVTVQTDNGTGGYTRVKGATVLVSDKSAVTDKKGVADLAYVPIGKVTVTVQKEGYRTQEEVVSMGGDLCEKTIYISRDDSNGHSYIKKMQNTLSRNSVGNIVIIPENTVKGKVTFSLEKQMENGETFQSYYYQLVGENGEVRKTGKFDSDYFMIDTNDMQAGDKLYFGMNVKQKGDAFATVPQNANFRMIEQPQFLNKITFNINKITNAYDLPNNGVIEADAFVVLKMILGALGDEEFKEKAMSLLSSLHLELPTTDEKAAEMSEMMKKIKLILRKAAKMPAKVSYDVSGKVMLSVTLAERDSSKVADEDLTDLEKTLIGIANADTGNEAKLTGKVKIDVTLAYNQVLDNWDMTVYGTLEGARNHTFDPLRKGLVYADSSFDVNGNLKMQLYKTSIGNKDLDQLSDLFEFREGKLTGKVKADAGGMLGSKDLASIGLFGNIGMTLGFFPLFKVLVDAKVGWEGCILFFKQKGTWTDGTFQLFPQNSAEARVMTREMLEAGSAEDAQYTTDTGTDNSKWTGSDKELASDVYYDISPQTVALPDGSTLMVYTNYSQNKDSDNPVELYYTRYKDGKWTEPKSVKNDGTVGMYPSLTATEQGAELTWMNMKEKLSDMSECTYSEIVAKVYGNMAVYKATYDTKTDSWNLTETASDGTLIASPSSASGDSSEMTVWITNKANTENATAQEPDSLKFVEKSNGTMINSGEIQIPGQYYDLTSVSVSKADSQYRLTAQMIDDSGKGRIGISSYDGSSWSEMEVIPSGDVYSPVQLNGSVYYISNSQIFRYEDGREKMLLRSELLNSLEKFTIANYGADGLILAWAPSTESSGLYVAFSENGSVFSEPVKAAETEGICGAPLINITEDGGLKLIYQQMLSESSMVYNLKSVTVKPGVNIRLSDLNTDGMIYGGAEVTTSFTWTSAGTVQVTSVHAVVSKDEKGEDIIAEKTIETGNTGVLTWTVPEDYHGEEYYLVLKPAGDQTDIDPSDNVSTIGNAMRDTELVSAEYTGDDEDGTGILVTLRNNGIVDSGALKLKVTEIKDNTETQGDSSDSEEMVLLEQEVEELKAGDTRDLSLSIQREKGDGGIYVEIISELEENDTDNNRVVVLIHNSYQIEEEPDAPVNPEPSVPQKPPHVHTWDSGAVTKRATALAAGIRTFKCKGCGQKKTAAIPKLTPTIRLNVTTLPMKTGQITKAVKVTGLAAGDYIKGWKSSNPGIAKVDAKGKITAQKKTGKAVITVTLASRKTASLTVNVGKSKVKTTKISGIASTVTLQKNKKTVLRPILTPLTSQDKITYTTSNKKIVTVTSSGVVTAKKSGTAKITIKAGQKKITVRIVIPKTKTKDLRNVPQKKTLKKGKSFKISAKTVPSASDEKITYKSSNTKIVSVDSKGKVVAKKKGSAKITVKSGKVTKTVTVTVK